MKRLLFWGTATALLAAVVHLFVVIFVPGVDTGQKMAELESAGQVNRLHLVSDPAANGSVLTESSPDVAYAFCKYDISRRPLMVQGNIPPSYWSVSVYSETGDNYYTLNDLQAGVDTLSFMVVRENENFKEEARPENTIIVRSPTLKGLILFRAFIPDSSQAKQIESYLSGSKCELRPVASAHR